jgi:hypothetical protein
MKIMYLGIAVWPSWDVAMSKMWIWRKSIDRFGYDFKYYGIGTKRWPGYRAQKVESQLEYLVKSGTGGASHVFYTDCCDCLMLADAAEIESKYKAMGSPPMLVQSASQLGNVSDGSKYPYFDERYPGVKFRYPCVGGYLMEVPLLRQFLQRMHDEYPEKDGWGDDCFIWYEGFQQGWFRPHLDTKCEIWTVGHEDNLEVKRGRLYNPLTDSWPCLWHNSGGSANQETFKDHMMIPMARRLGILGEDEVKP